MTNLEFRNALKNGTPDVIYTDIDGTEYTHTILKAGKKQITLLDHFSNSQQYNLPFQGRKEGYSWVNYRLK